MTLMSAAANVALPATLEYEQYRRYNSDLTAFSDTALAEHYALHGESEGRRANSLGSRQDFAALISQAADGLEIGPFNNPLLRGKRVAYFDVLPRPKLIERAKSLGFPTAGIPEIEFVSSVGDLTIVDRAFDCVLSSHCIEHQPDLIRHLREVERLLRGGGRYFVLAPDKRYCFDHFIAESTLADVLDAHHEKRTVHSLKSVLEHRVLTTHNDSVRHWAHDHGIYLEECAARTTGTLAEFAAANGSYIDVHAWYLTPSSTRQMLAAVPKLGYTSFEIERMYPTRRDASEFWFVLRRGT